MANRSAVFYSGSNPGAHQSDTAPTFDEAQADSERASQVFLSKRTEADFRAWREQRTGKPYSRLRKCPCGEVFDMHGPDEVFLHVARITAAERSMMSPLMSVNAKLWYA
jgi:hypothetical protein